MAAKKKNIHAQALAKLGASKGGRARAAKLSKEELSEQGRKAVTARWAKSKADSAAQPKKQPAKKAAAAIARAAKKRKTGESKP
jgi:hypothetical protein